jgi:predicted nucleic acid-binding protein
MYKEHVRLNDTDDLLTYLPLNIWQEVERLEIITNITYFPVSGSVSWQDLGVLIQYTGLSPTDAMIVNYALAIGADAICTADCDYACVHNLIDVYMPVSEASKCVAYNPAID